MLNHVRIALIAAVTLALGVVLLQKAGEYLVMNQPVHADVVVVLTGDRNDRRFFRGLELVHQGSAPRMFVDANSDMILFGRTPAVLEDELIKSLNLNLGQVRRVCPSQGDSTDEESRYVAQCLHSDPIRSVLLVTSDFHTHRAISIFKQRLPRYQWSVAAARDDTVFNQKWWQRREWAKTAFFEWTKLVWWEAVDRWRH